MIMSIALRFIPILTEETDKIMKAQMARGADFETGGIVKKAKAMIPLLVPLFISAFLPGNRSGDGDGSQMLSRRQGQDEDVPPYLCWKRLPRLCDPVSLSRSADCSPGTFVNRYVM